MAINILNAEVHHYFDRFTELTNARVENSYGEQRIVIPDHIGTGSLARTRIRPGMEIMVTDITYHRNMELRIQEACPLFELSYCFSGEIHCEWDNRHSHTSNRTGNVLFFQDELVHQEKKAGVRNQLLEIRLSPEELFHYAGDLMEKRRMQTWLQRHRGNIDRYLDTQTIHQCAVDLLQCNLNGTMRRLYMESKAMEFIALFGEIDGFEPASGNEWGRDDISKLNRVRDLAVQHFEQPLSIRELARITCLNEFKLKKGFRELFGMTVFELVRKTRMEKALWYMEVERLNVGETAISVGYSNASNFTAAFRKHYGCNPSEYLKSL